LGLGTLNYLSLIRFSSSVYSSSSSSSSCIRVGNAGISFKVSSFYLSSSSNLFTLIPISKSSYDPVNFTALTLWSIINSSLKMVEQSNGAVIGK
jgi:hypothetical protein